MSDLDPYRPPVEPLALSGGDEPTAVCPKCGANSAKRVGYTWWGGALGPKLLHVVKCRACGTQYNGRTGSKLTGAIITYQGVLLAIGTAAWYFLSRRHH